jgi:hypothetical protein
LLSYTVINAASNLLYIDSSDNVSNVSVTGLDKLVLPHKYCCVIGRFRTTEMGANLFYVSIGWAAKLKTNRATPPVCGGSCGGTSQPRNRMGAVGRTHLFIFLVCGSMHVHMHTYLLVFDCATCNGKRKVVFGPTSWSLDRIQPWVLSVCGARCAVRGVRCAVCSVRCAHGSGQIQLPTRNVCRFFKRISLDARWTIPAASPPRVWICQPLIASLILVSMLFTCRDCFANLGINVIYLS